MRRRRASLLNALWVLVALALATAPMAHAMLHHGLPGAVHRHVGEAGDAPHTPHPSKPAPGDGKDCPFCTLAGAKVLVSWSTPRFFTTPATWTPILDGGITPQDGSLLTSTIRGPPCCSII